MSARAFLMATVVMLASCTGKDPYNPGESLGTFTVDTKRLTASCGEGQLPPEPWRFDVKLAFEEAQTSRTIFWIQGGAPVSGFLDASNRATMKSSDQRTLREATKERAACVVRREDVLEATFDVPQAGAKMEVRSFKGSLRYRFVPEDGSDCLDVIGPATFDTLPCDVAFELSGAPKTTSTR